MLIRMLAFALLALFGAPGWATDRQAELNECRAFEAEKASLIAAGVVADMEKGPEWASANLPPDRLEQIKRYIRADEKLKFYCPEIIAAAVVREQEERARQEAREAQLWAEKLAEFAKDPLPPEQKPAELARLKHQDTGGPPLPERAAR